MHLIYYEGIRLRWKALIDVKQPNTTSNERKEAKMKRLLFFTVLCMGIAIFLAGPVCARVTGPCANCHTMHTSQDGVVVYPDGPYDCLLAGDCVGCHSNDGSSTTYLLGTSIVPVVNYTSGEPSEYLAGGNFYWVANSGGNDDAKGHNVLGIADEDVAIPRTVGAPGNQYGGGCQTNGCHGSLAIAISGQDASLNGGCQGCHLKVRHHANDGTGAFKYVNSETQGWYRFLARHSGTAVTNNGVEGIEDADWQATTGATDHNEYLGIPVDKTGSTSLTNGSMTAFCCGCHGNFHIQSTVASGDPWIRHPSDFVIPSEGEYSDITTYAPLSPVARPAGFAWVAGVPSPDAADGTDMVMCLSCHRPHGSPYADLLRWNYAATEAGSGTSDTGCFYCHTTKNES